MLKLKNIKRTNDVISAEYDPEDSGELGSVSVDIKSKEITDYRLSKLDEDFPIYLNHAADALVEMASKKELPEERLVMWY